MTADGMRHVVLAVQAHDGSSLRVAAVGLEIPSAPGLLITPWYTPDGPARGRFTLTHAASGQAVINGSWCSHDARRWAVAAGWVGVDWRTGVDTLCDNGAACTFAWRLHDEWRPYCDTCR